MKTLCTNARILAGMFDPGEGTSAVSASSFEPLRKAIIDWEYDQ